ncbi:5,10-methenyltetrahydrofolate synthetase [Candidatus Photodesmus blepharus]|uniref:5-formyltetrahydrofolate cyclo-ligase n=1 Tax=Candidatus Photodesmus blepharonis TaxID=1179155 RepID=A0A084CMH9_9GAMM|nr:5-formyltetrahydrofolate cyclo-ligase [Candidatus Photodesmus blepharus]KEY91008.1 5,10-methenyltetrahydrofolate synthetase [Candidatus Photodesmus blepharus]
MILSRQNFRKQIREKRNRLCKDEQHQASLSLSLRFSTLPELLICQHIALYISSDGEIDTKPLIERLWKQGKQTYLPVIHPFSKGCLLFLHYDSNTSIKQNTYGIFEPELNKTCIKPISQIDLICTPLVGFDSLGYRLGMGGGYYDRTLKEWFITGVGAIPIGLAYDFQHVDQLPIKSWDIPLPKIVTPTQIWQW